MSGPALGTERIASVELVLPSGTGVTLHVPDWDGEVGFLGLGEQLYLFRSPAELAAFLSSGAPNDLEEHPSWGAVRNLDDDELVPLEQDRYDLPAVTDALAEEPEDWDLDRLSAHAAMLRDLVDALAPDLSARFAPGTPLGDLALSPERYETGDDDAVDALLGAAVEVWDAALDSVDEWVAWPEPGATPVEGAAGTATGSAGDRPAVASAGRTERGTRELTFWDEVDLYPLELTLPSGHGWTVYTEVDADGTAETSADEETEAVFLGRHGSMELFRTQEGLAARLADPAPHDLTTHAGWPKVAAAAAELGDDLDLSADPADVYDLTAVQPALRDGPGRWDPVELRRGLEIAADLADFLGRTDVLPAFDDRAPLGRVLASLDGDPLPPGVAGDAAEVWQRVLTRLDASVRWAD